MRNNKSGGFTLIELLIVIAIIGILAAVLIPNLLNARERAFDTAAQTCLREISTQFEVVASNSPFEYDDATITIGNLNGCTDVTAAMNHTADGGHFVAVAQHNNGSTEYIIRNGRGVVPTSQDAGPAAGVTLAAPTITVP